MSERDRYRDRAVARVMILVTLPLGVASLCMSVVWDNVECGAFGLTLLVSSVFLYSKYVAQPDPMHRDGVPRHGRARVQPVEQQSASSADDVTACKWSTDAKEARIIALDTVL